MGSVVLPAGARSKMRKYLLFVFALNAWVEALLGILMIVWVNLFFQIVYVVEPSIFIQMIGAFGLCLALLSGFVVYRLWSSKTVTNNILDVTIFFFCFHTVLSVVLGSAARSNLMSWVGFFTHVPLAVLFGIAMIWELRQRKIS